jgi:hypothetical protein
MVKIKDVHNSKERDVSSEFNRAWAIAKNFLHFALNILQ